MEINPCNASGGEVDENDFVDDPKELVGKSLHFKILVPHARGLNAKYDKVCYIQTYSKQDSALKKKLTFIYSLDTL